MKKIILSLLVLGVLFSCQKEEVYEESNETSDLTVQKIETKADLNKIIVTALKEGRYFKWSELTTDDLWTAIQLSDNKINVFWSMDEGATSKTANSIADIILSNEGNTSKSQSPIFETSKTLNYVGAEVTNKQTLLELLNSKDVVYVEPLYEMYSENELQGLASQQTQINYKRVSNKKSSKASFNPPAHPGVSNSKVESAWQKGYDGKGITVAVVDNGVYREHPLFGEGITTNKVLNPVTGEQYSRNVEKLGFFKDNPFAFWQDNDGNYVNEPIANPHGQGMMNLIGGAATDEYYQNNGSAFWGTGVAYGANMLSIRSSRTVFIGLLSSRLGVKRAFEYLATRNDVKVVSMSQGLVFWDEGIARAIRRNSDKLIFCAGGTAPGLILFPLFGIADLADLDFDKRSVTLFPAKMAEVYSVTGVNDKNTWCFDCFGKADFVLEFSDENTPFFFKDGGSSSVATATTAGIAALIWGTNPNASAADVIGQMKELSENPVNRDADFGHGRIDLSNFNALGASTKTMISLKGSNNRFVSSENGQQSIKCNRSTIGSWEKFELITLSDGKVALKGSNGKYVSSENGKKSMICNRTTMGDWEKFEIITLSDGRIALKGNNGRYVSSENGTKSMNCNRRFIGSWEKFNIIYQ